MRDRVDAVRVDVPAMNIHEHRGWEASISRLLTALSASAEADTNCWVCQWWGPCLNRVEWVMLFHLGLGNLSALSTLTTAWKDISTKFREINLVLDRHRRKEVADWMVGVALPFQSPCNTVHKLVGCLIFTQTHNVNQGKLWSCY